MRRALAGESEAVNREEILLPDRQSAELAAAARRDNPAAVSQIPLEYVDDTLGFNPEWVVDRIAPRPVLFVTTDDDRLVPPEESAALYERAGEPKKLVVLKGYGHYEVYTEPAFGEVMTATLAWYGEHLPAAGPRVKVAPSKPRSACGPLQAAARRLAMDGTASRRAEPAHRLPHARAAGQSRMGVAHGARTV